MNQESANEMASVPAATRLLTKRTALTSAVALAVVAVAVLAIIGSRSSKEPSYAHKSLSFWCDQLPFTEQGLPRYGGGFTRAFRGSTNQAEQNTFRELERQGLDAIDALGTNCLPKLLARLQKRNSPLQHESRKLAARLGLIKRSEVGLWHMRRMRALTGIVELGDRAKGIVPELTALKADPDPWLSAAASYALSQIATKAAERLDFEERKKRRNAGLTNPRE